MLVFKAWRKSPALTQETTPSQRRITRILSDAQQAAAREFGQQLTQVADALSTGHVDRVVAMLPTEPWLAAQEALAEELLGELLDAGSRVTLPSIEKATIQYSFDRGRPESSQWARQTAGSLIAQVTSEQRGVVRDVVAEAALGGLDWGDVAQRVQGSIGLTAQQSGWVANHYDQAYTTAIRNGLSASQARTRARESASRYQTSVHRYRANTIARTETMRAASEGRVQAWNQGITEGFITAAWQKEWVAEASACQICLPLNGRRVGVKQQFPVGEPPAHPNCRCDVILVPPKATPAGEGRDWASTAFTALTTLDDLATLGQIGAYGIEQIQEWRQAYEIATGQGDRRSFGEWFEDVIEPDTTAYAYEGEPGQTPLDWLPDPDDILANGVDLDEVALDYADLSFSREQWNSLSDYQFTSFLPINRLLRAGADLGKYLRDVQLIDSLFDMVPAFNVTNGQFFRTIDEDVLALLRRGDTFTEYGYMSTSVSRRLALEFGEDAGYYGKMRIIDAGGARKLWMDGVTGNTGFGQGEVLFARGTKLIYLGKDRDGWSVFTTVDDIPAPSRVNVPPAAVTFMDDYDFAVFRDDSNLTDWKRFMYVPERFKDSDAWDALQWYAADGYAEVNDYLLGGSWDDDDDGVLDPPEAAKILLELIRRSPGLSRNIRVWRGINNVDYLDLDNLTPGSIFRHDSFMSTSLALEQAAQFPWGGDDGNFAILRINAPKGSKAVYIESAGELEVLFAAGVKLKFIKVAKEYLPRFDEFTPTEPVTVIYVEVVP
jgi:SPP1 gp7 family putative phage head morphogenesis protein